MIFSFLKNKIRKRKDVRLLFGVLLFNTWELVYDAHETKLVDLERKTTD